MFSELAPGTLRSVTDCKSTDVPWRPQFSLPGSGSGHCGRLLAVGAPRGSDRRLLFLFHARPHLAGLTFVPLVGVCPAVSGLRAGLSVRVQGAVCLSCSR